MPITEITHSLFRDNIPEVSFLPHTVFSFPVPVRRGEVRLEAVFLYSRADGETADTGTRPYAWALLCPHTGSIEQFSQCRVQDFINSQRYPLGEAVSMKLPRKLSGKKYAAASQKLLACYDRLRPFVLEQELSQEQRKQVEDYRELFRRLAYDGHQPFYQALAPEFFHWLGLPLTGAGSLTEELKGAGEEQYRMAVLQTLESLAKQFGAKIAADAHKEKLFDALHQELQEYKNDLLNALTRSVELDVIQLIDHTRKTVEAFRDKPADEENCRRLLSLLEGVETDLTDLLYRHGVEPYTLPGQRAQVPRQKVISTVSTQDRSQDRKIARRVACGWEKAGCVVRPERVTVYVYEATEADRMETGMYAK